jgi:D-inositol-3-phosphate glycosyltransferase
VAFLSFHTSPLEQPGTGRAGGMNVYVHELATALARRGIDVDVFARADRADPSIAVDVRPRYRVVPIRAGPLRPLAVEDQIPWLGRFAAEIQAWMGRFGVTFDLVHSHYWLSGWAGLMLARGLSVPLVNSFHTLGRVKRHVRRPFGPPEALLRIAAESEVISGSAAVIVSTPYEAADLMSHYGADPSRLCLSPPGVDHRVFGPGSAAAARRVLGWGRGPHVLFVGRIDPLKRLDVVVDALAVVRNGMPEAELHIVGGAGGPGGRAELRTVLGRIRARGLGGSVVWHAARPHRQLVDFYRAADVLVVPSESESFGLVAAEAQACGLPVVAARVGGLRYAVADGESGLLVEGWDPADYAEALQGILADSEEAMRLSKGAVEFAARFSWEGTVRRILRLYRSVVGESG